MSTTTLNAPVTGAISLDQFDPHDAADSSTLQFIAFYLANPNDAMSKSFANVITSKSKTLDTDVAAFFAAYAQYTACTLDSYLAGIIYQAQHADTASLPADQKKYGLSTLVKLLGGKWPDGLPDVAIAKPSCSVSGGLLEIDFELDFATLSFENAIIAGNVRKLVTDASVQASLQCNYQPGVFIFETKIIVVLNDIQLPLGNAQTLSVTRPTISLDITPEFKYVVFTMIGDIPATIFNTPVDVDISLIVDNDEASIGASIAGNGKSLPAPPGVKGLHFDQIGACMGLFFEPPGFAFGLQGKFHIGDSTAGTIVDLDDDTFAVVCEYVEEAIAPKYVSFYVPKLSINEVIELFTNANPNIDIPVNFSELGFRWSTGINDSVALPDGTLSQAGWGFSADVDIFSFQFHGDANLDLNSGLTADLEMAPLSWKNVFQLSGDGKGYSVKIDGNGNPIRNNQVINTQALQDAVANATQKQLVAPGGPVLIINTLSMPILHLNAKASLFEIANYDIQADVNKDGIKFELDYGVLLTTKMVCNLTDFHNLYAEFGYFIDHSIPLPPIAGQSLGSIPLKADIDAHLTLTTSASLVTLSTGGQFDFGGYHFSFGELSGAVNISKITELIEAVVNYIVDEAETVFKQFRDSAEQWAEAAGKGIVTGFDDAGKVMNNAFHKSTQEATSILKGAGFTATQIGKALHDGYNSLSQDVASLLKGAGFAANDVADAIRNTWNCELNDVAWAMQWVGYSATEVGKAVQHTFGTLAQDATNCLMHLSYTAKQIGSMIKDAFGGDSIAVAKIMKTAGYLANDVADAIQNAWNCQLNDVAWAMQWVGYSATEVGKAVQHTFGTLAQDAANCLMHLSYTANEIGSMIKDAFGGDSPGVAKVMRGAGYKAEEVAGAIRNAWNCHVGDVVWAMQQVGYGVREISGAVRSAFGDVAQELANAFKRFGVGAQDAADALKNDYGRVINDTASILKQAGYAASDVASGLKNAFDVSVDAVASAMKAVGYAGGEVKDAFVELGGDFKNFAESTWKTLKDPDTWNPTKW